ncbi:GyrI-like domain-containing protein [Agromyces seonyuensis]|uniref:GyrI-like small molecule binding domain-containing protein n=1 Tax=Agromyces seonyuensis TaxID=2662446 RepID=A0A6I4NSH4_9MICO|nr:GyrI-like domain-containing protein [Agromyces seonyuensis]MWB97203.1 hypothetical protein [Agromyces seonyuensis]
MAAPTKLDLTREHRALFTAPTADFVEVDVPELTHLALAGHGDPNTAPAYAEAVGALYAVSYSLKMTSKRSGGPDWTVAPLEGLWDAADPSVFTRGRKTEWDWTMLILQPAHVDAAAFEAAVAAVATKKPELAEPLARLELRRWTEGRSLQILHVGPYDDEAPTLARLHDEVMPERGLAFDGLHHEVYLGDPRRAAPEKLRTILRQPVRPSVE